MVSHCMREGDDRKGKLYFDLPECTEVNSLSSLMDIPEKEEEGRELTRVGRGHG